MRTVGLSTFLAPLAHYFSSSFTETAKNALTDQAVFEFNSHDLETIHLAVLRWCDAHGIGIDHPCVVEAARCAFRKYRPDMDELDLAAAIDSVANLPH